VISVQLRQGTLFVGLSPDARQFGLDLMAHAPGDGIEHVALLVHQTALTRGGGKQLRDRRKPPIMPIRHDEVDLGGSS
jgi:hypothetical protein